MGLGSGVVWTNGIVSLTRDFIFGVSVLAEGGWTPFDQLDDEDKRYIARLVDHNPSCPWLEELRT
jgi:hypothetical protein